MGIFYRICYSISVGILIGFLVGGIRMLKKPTYSESRVNATKKIVKKVSGFLKYITFLFLSLGLVWCIYYLVLGILVPEQTEYATNVSQLIVSVLTIVSIIFAFFEFLRGKPDQKQ